MKITRKVLVAILTLAILATGFAVTAFAANEPASDDSYKSVLEYYESNVYFIDDFSETTDANGTPAFTGKADSEFDFSLAGSAGAFGTTFKIVNSDTYGDYLRLSTQNKSSFLFTPSKLESFGINMRTSLAKAAAVIDVVLTGNGSTPIVSVENGKVSIYDPSTGTLAVNQSAVVK